MAILLSASSLPSLQNTKLCNSRDISAERNIISTYPFLTGFNRKNNKETSIVCLSVKGHTKAKNFEVINGNNSRKNGVKVVLSEGRDEDENLGHVCPGCGVYMQDKDPNHPGFYKKRKVEVDDEGIEGFFDEEEEGFVDEIEGSLGMSDGEKGDVGVEDEIEGSLGISDGEESDVGMEDWDSDEWEEDDLAALDGFYPVGVGYGNVTEEVLKEKENKKKRLSKAERKRLAREAQKERDVVTVCARCHSLRNYGHVKNQTAENLIPDFDFDRLISTRLMKPSTADSTVVVMVVDCVDFDGSFPKRAARSLFKALEGKHDAKFSKKLPKLVLVATKVDLLPSEISPTRLDRWVRHRARAAGAPKLNAVYLVSSRKDLGVRNLLASIKESAGPRGHVWVIGAQNAGKSTLINTFAKKEGAKVTKLTEAAVPGTTLGILRVGGVLSGKAKMYDTPGLLHPYLMSLRLTREEQKMIEIRKELRPRSYRIKARQTIHVGGLVRLDLVQASVQTIYVTVWASPNVSLHLGKSENADETWIKHAGIRLQPPIGTDRLSEMGSWTEREFKVTGTSWDVNSSDIAVAGLGWLSLGLKGDATLKLRTYDSVEVVLREPLALDRAPYLERPGFWLPQAISDALGNQSKLEDQKRQRLEEESEYVTA
ncbi:GTP-binding protein BRASSINAZOLE INSENSITIVE PALE GREEN 2, chloroplastic [Beta vulgaris subsp. vulgaris]|uniref:GTP-binding protein BRASSINAZOLE INSENSITIVE PALE GREEN 2, chloroplastic n=1 Tax=Beta vulgaris subsp. vulgaris TaxID=3555 RepID=UPI002547DAF2|nr:GTP-binding protein BRASSINAZOLE INSENSITIVE PALE GREEN 2, chloroplastic [Beta vulgaris subsp. vulgaris]